jgi:hypothetical protein
MCFDRTAHTSEIWGNMNGYFQHELGRCSGTHRDTPHACKGFLWWYEARRDALHRRPIKMLAISHSKKIIWALPSPGNCGSRRTWYKASAETYFNRRRPSPDDVKFRDQRVRALSRSDASISPRPNSHFTAQRQRYGSVFVVCVCA